MNGVPLPVVARLLGHSNVRMTMRYAHVGDREVEAAADLYGRTWRAWVPRMTRPGIGMPGFGSGCRVRREAGIADARLHGIRRR